MAKQNINSKTIALRLNVAFLIVLFLFILCFYLFPRFKQFHTDLNPSGDLTFEIIEIPVTVQNKIADSQPKRPEILPEFADIQILDSVFIAIQDKIGQNNETEIDSQIIAYISDLFPELLEIKEFDPQPIIEKSKKVYNFKNYFAYRMNLPDTGKPHEPSSPLVDEALGKSKDLIMIEILRVPLSSTTVVNIEKMRLTLADLLDIKEYFHLLEYFYEKSGLSLLELYNTHDVNELYTYNNLSKAVESLWKQGLLKAHSKQTSKIYSIAFTIPEMIENINRILSDIPKQDQQNIDYLNELIHLLITWS